VANSSKTVEASLDNLQRLIRLPPPETPAIPAMWRRVPEDLRTDDLKTLGLLAAEAAALVLGVLYCLVRAIFSSGVF